VVDTEEIYCIIEGKSIVFEEFCKGVILRDSNQESHKEPQRCTDLRAIQAVPFVFLYCLHIFLGETVNLLKIEDFLKVEN